MDLSDLWMSAPSQLFRAIKETCSQFGAQRTLVLFGLPDTLRPAYTYVGVQRSVTRCAHDHQRV
eukprot:7977160-Alexandrium_andersonii.AAC.1